MTKTLPVILLLLPCAALLASCGAKPTPAPPLSAAPPASGTAVSGNTAPGSQALYIPSNPNRPANIPALGIPAGVRRSHAAGQ